MEVFAYSGLINAILAFALGIFVIFRNRRNRVNQLYFLLVVAIIVWSIGYWQWLSSDNSDSALFWVRIFSIGSTLIPVFFFHWIVSFLEKNKKEKRAVILVYLIGSLFLLFSFSDLLVKGVREKMFFLFWPDPGVLYHFYIVFTYVLLVGYSFCLLYKSYKVSTGSRKAQIIYVLVGSAIGFGGGLTNFFLWYNIPIPPYGNFLVALYPFFLGYAMLKHHLFDVRVIATEVLIFAIWIFLGIETALSFSEGYKEFLINSGLLIAVIVVGVLLIRSVLKEVKQKEKLQVLTKKIKRAYKIEKKALEVEKKAHKELKRLDEAKNQFLMATQHHLRTPLTSMQGYLDLMFGGTYGKVPVKLKKTLEKLHVSTNRLIKIVNELLDLSQFQLGKRVISPKPNIRIEPLLKEIVEELKFEADNKHLYLTFEKPKKAPPTANIDPGKIKVALYNIVDNGIKYTYKGGVTIKARSSDHKLLIEISDTGIGFIAEELKGLFSRTFERGEEAKKVFSTGKGIGLYIAHKIIDAHKGKVWVESKGKGKGSTFFVELPVK